jgi:FlaA1/EpsC-like NDP-sugar epimerase
MNAGINSFDWNSLLPARDMPPGADSIQNFHAGKTILVTGAGGSIGSSLVHAIAARKILAP